jgi:uncharacterized protein (DUF2336 family)
MYGRAKILFGRFLIMTQMRFSKLIDLAQAPSSTQRRELLREVTDLFFETSGSRSARESALFDEVLQLVAAEMQEGVLAELAEVFADAEDAPLGLLRDLSNHAFAVAAPILQRGKLIDDSVLLDVVNYQSQDHIKAVAARQAVSEAVSAAIVRFGDDHALDTLIRNDGASIPRASMETVVERARQNAMLHAGVVRRKDIPLDLLNEMYFVVEAGLRDQILKRNGSVDATTLDAALARTRERMRKSAGDMSAETRNAIHFITQKKNSGELNARLLVSLYREAKLQHFLCGLAELTDIDRETAADLIERKDMDGLAMVCRAANIERPLFVTLAVLACGGDDAMARAEEFGRTYNAVPLEAAQRAMRFFKVRKAATQAA